MPHSLKEQHLEDLCSQCKKPHGNHITIENYGPKFYEVIECQHCGYEIIRLIKEKIFTDKFVMSKK